MAWPIHSKNHVNTPLSKEALSRHLVHREAIIAIVIVFILCAMALLFATMLFPNMILLAAMFFFAYMFFFTLPMWGGLFEDDIEDEIKRNEAIKKE